MCIQGIGTPNKVWRAVGCTQYAVHLIFCYLTWGLWPQDQLVTRTGIEIIVVVDLAAVCQNVFTLFGYDVAGLRYFWSVTPSVRTWGWSFCEQCLTRYCLSRVHATCTWSARSALDPRSSTHLANAVLLRCGKPLVHNNPKRSAHTFTQYSLSITSHNIT
jgi:hypothetical protein